MLKTGYFGYAHLNADVSLRSAALPLGDGFSIAVGSSLQQSSAGLRDALAQFGGVVVP